MRAISHGKKILIDRYKRLGRKSLVRFIDMSDEFSMPAGFTEVYDFGALTSMMRDEELLKLAKEHLGGGEEYNSVAVFNQTTLGTICVLIALAKPGSTVVSFAPDQASEHISMRRGKQLAGRQSVMATTPSELEQLVGKGNVSLIAITSAYGSMMQERDLKRGIEIGKEHGIPTYVDDAFGARMRTLLFNQAKAADMGADLVITGTNKFGLYGPQAGLMLGRDKYMKTVIARATEIGALARPAIVAAAIDVLRRFDPESFKKDVKKWADMCDDFVGMANSNGIPFHTELPTRTRMNLEDVMEIAMRKAGVSKSEIVPCEATRSFSMHLLTKHGCIIDPSIGKPGTNMNVTAFFSFPDVFWVEGGASTLLEGCVEAFDVLSKLVVDPKETQKMLFGE